jgi:thymidylate synthase (FAD)
MKIVQPSVELVWITPDPYQNIEKAGRTCYKSEDKITDDSAVKFCGMIKQRGHESVVEHAVASFKIICDRGVSHEIVRHRIASYSQESTRYCNYSKDKFGNEISVIEPPGLTLTQRGSWVDAVQFVETEYLWMIENGVSPQIARSILPNCLKTEIVMTANFREWMHFIKLRTSPAAHPQIRPIAEEIRKILAAYCPTIFEVPDHFEITLKAEEAQALRNYIEANGKDAEVNPTLLQAFKNLLKKLGA